MDGNFREVVISVIIPMYNGERTIERCLDSVIYQSFKCNYEILIINDESKDNSKKIVEQYIKVHNDFNIQIIDKKNGGAATARNVGLRIAKGRWIALLDCDDEWLPGKISMQMEILKRNPNIDCLGGNLQDQQTRILGVLINKLSKIHQWQLFIKIYPQTSTVLFRKELIDEVGLYDESLKYYEDGDFWLRIAKEKEFWFSPEPVVIYDGGKAGFGVSGMTARLYEMHAGNKIVLARLYKAKKLGFIQYILAYLYAEIKYIRRRLITQIRKI